MKELLFVAPVVSQPLVPGYCLSSRYVPLDPIQVALTCGTPPTHAVLRLVIANEVWAAALATFTLIGTMTPARISIAETIAAKFFFI